MAQDHHVISQGRIKDRVGEVAVKAKLYGADSLTPGERNLLNTPLSQVLNDRRNIVKLSVTLHHRAHHGANPHRLKRKQLPRGIHDFAEHFALEGALDRQLRLIDEAEAK